MKRVVASLLSLGALTFTAHAIDPLPYLDDRSTPESLVSSLYNAINRHEYVRAWSYFDESAVALFDTYEAGFAGTGHVEAAVGIASGEGAAGSTFWKVPVAIRSHLTGGATKTFAGCYTLRLAQPQIQSPPFEPIHIVGAKLSPAGEGDLTALIPDACLD